MVHQIMLLRVALKSGYIATQIAENGFSPAWSSGICSFSFFSSSLLPLATKQRKAHSSMVQRSMLLEVLVHTVKLPQNMQVIASLLYGLLVYASSD